MERKPLIVEADRSRGEVRPERTAATGRREFLARLGAGAAGAALAPAGAFPAGALPEKAADPPAPPIPPPPGREAEFWRPGP
jgi:hypothetical protein